jgi:hypothetical protein
VGFRVGAEGGPTPVDVLVTVASANGVTSPISGDPAAIVFVELFEGPELLGSVVFGDLVTLSIEGSDLAIDIVVRRAQLAFVDVPTEPVPIEAAPSELVPLLQRARRGGIVLRRERLVRHGDRLRLRAIVEPAADRLIAREDLAPVRLDEVLSF